MKTITNRFLMRCLAVLCVFFIQESLFSQISVEEDPILETFSSTYSTSLILETNECTANDLRVTDLYLGDISGNPITASCEPGTPQSAFIYGTLTGPTNANRYSLRISYDLYINEQYVETREVCQYDMTPIPVDYDINVQSIDYNCGDRIELRNFYMAWQSSAQKTCGNNPSKCYFFPPGFVVDAPLVTNFDYENPCTSLDVNFTDLTTGGDIENPYSYSWDFGDGGSSALANPTHTYANPGTYSVTLEVTDSQGIIDAQQYDVTVYPPLEGLSLSAESIDCSDDNDGTITANGVSGGFGVYTYTIEPEPAGFIQNNNIFSNLPSGNYTVTVTDERNCTISSSTTINVGDPNDPTITAPANLNVSACNTSDIMKDGSTFLPFSDVETEITADQFLQESGLFTEENLQSITYIDVASGSCPILVTRTFTITDECNNMASDSQTISLFDKDAPTAPEAPENITVECIDDVPVAENLEAEDECDGTVAGVVTDETNDSDTCNIVITRTWTFTDSCDNESSVSQTITVSDTTAPVAPEDLETANYQCIEEVPAVSDLTANDNCDGDIIATAIDDVNDTNPCAIVITRTWTFTDSCNNTSVTTQIINVGDTTDPELTNPAENIEISCSGDDNDGTLQSWLDNNGGATATDNCGSLTWSNNYGSAESDCSETIEVIFTATDDCGNSVSTTATYAVVDSNGPTIVTPASNVTVECDGEGNLDALNQFLNSNGGAVATDDCSAVSWSNDFSGLSDDCGATGSATVTFTAVDGCGNISETTATFTIEDTTAPVITLPAENTNVECDGSGNIAEYEAFLNSNGGAVAEDSCSEVTWSYIEDPLSEGCGNTSYRKVTFFASDDCGNQSETVSGFYIIDTTPPTLTEAQDLTIECGENVEEAYNNWISSYGGATATDICSDRIEWSVDDSAGLSDDCGATGSITVTFTASDDCSNAVSTTATFTIVDTTAPVIETEASNTNIECTGEDNDGSLQAWLDNNGGAVASDNCGTVTWSNDYGQTEVDNCSAAISVTFTATDECGNTASTSATYSLSDTVPPSITTEASDVTVECTGDGNEADLLDFLNSNGGAVASDDCSAISWSNDFTGLSDDCGLTGSATVTFTATDGCGNTSSTTATFTIEDTTAPSISEAIDATAECGSDTEAALQAWIDNNGGATASDDCSETISWSSQVGEMTDECGETGSMTVTFTATDDCGNSASTSAVFQIVDTVAPTFTVPESVSVECDDDLTDLTLTGEVTGIEDDCSTEFEITYVDSETAGDCAGTYTITRTWTVSDACGNGSSQDQTISVVDTTGPTFTVPENVSIECTEDENDLSLTGQVTDLADNCSTDIEISFVDSETAGDCPSERVITRTWTATDECGNTTSLAQTISVVDTTAPTILGDLEPELSVSCSDIPGVPSLMFEDACTTEIDVQFEETSTDETQDTYTITRVWTATDECGNANSFTQTINVNNSATVIPSALGNICNDAEPFDLFTIIGSGVPTNGTFTVNSGNFNPSNGTIVNPSTLDIEGFYSLTYRVETEGDACATEYDISFTVIDCIVLPPPVCEPVISTAVTPNGDGINDTFTVELDPSCGFTIEVMIFNRWGAKVFESSLYNGEWSAQSPNSSVGSANTVPTGTYYYIITLKNSDLPPFTGPIYVGTK